MRIATGLLLLLLQLTASTACRASDLDQANLERYGKETLVPGQGLGDLRVGQSTLADVKELFGETNAFQHFPRSTEHHYLNGLTVVTEPGRDLRGVIRSIRAGENPYGTGAFKGKTDKGIGLGATPEEVVAAHGEPADFGSLKSILYYKNGVSFSLGYGRVEEIVIQKPAN